ncbi:MAG: NfeD family protein [Candidatus Dormibacteraeota bacterium]|nr:NfeD family protein [Candidatus Dormibacteraeota bacterium]MBV9525055.1 NfeD family protein [Candidatus Dormibacteraeota bacterium]
MWFWVVWLVAGLLLVAVEVHTQAFYAVFLALGAFAATIITAVGIPVWLSAVVFAIVALGGTLLVRPTLKRMSDRHIGPRLLLPGSSDALVGQRALTVDEVGDEHHPGHARLAGERWLAVTDEPGGVKPQTQVLVVEVRGTTLVVTPFAGG